MPSSHEYEKQSIEEIINQYIKEMALVIELVIGTKQKKEFLEEAFITQTKIMPDGFFNHSVPGESCNNKDVVLRKFGKAIIIFNDLKGSTDVLKWLEDKSLLCIYAAYMQYSSELLGRVLDLIDGKVVESTGDGNYSIIYSFKDDDLLSFSNHVNQFIKNNVNIGQDIFFRQYINAFDASEVMKIKSIKFPSTSFDWILEYITNRLSESFRLLFFLIFAKFNMAVNKILDDNSLKKLFFTRVGCKMGECQVTRIKVNGHILQDKLIGTVIHQAAHQANGK